MAPTMPSIYQKLLSCKLLKSLTYCLDKTLSLPHLDNFVGNAHVPRTFLIFMQAEPILLTILR
jgi:hypothetical protein